MDKILTVVVPTYNMENYLRKCLDSLIIEDKELFNTLEVLVVNDGSRDSSSAIAHEYQDKYPEVFCVIDKENGNYGSVMNVALGKSHGKYFKTLDADDSYYTNEVSNFLIDLKKSDADIVLSETIWNYEGKNKIEMPKIPHSFPVFEDIYIDRSLWGDWARSCYLIPNLCVKTTLLRDSGIHWPENVFYSDTLTCYYPLIMATTIRFLPIPVYIYTIGRDEQSMSNISRRRNFDSYNIVSNQLIDSLLSRNYITDINSVGYKIILERILNQFYMTLLYDGCKNIEAILNVENKLKQYSDLYKGIGKIIEYHGFPYLWIMRKIGFKTADYMSVLYNLIIKIKKP